MENLSPIKTQNFTSDEGFPEQRSRVHVIHSFPEGLQRVSVLLACGLSECFPPGGIELGFPFVVHSPSHSGPLDGIARWIRVARHPGGLVRVPGAFGPLY